MNNTVGILFTILPALLVLVLLIFIVRTAQKNPPEKYIAELNKRYVKTPFNRGYFLTGLMWLAVAAVNYYFMAKLHSDHRSAMSQEIMGPFWLAFGSYWIGLSAPRSYPQPEKQKKK